MSGPPVLPGFRATKPRDGSPPVTSTYSSLARTVRDAGLLDRTVAYYLLLLAGISVALSGVIVGMVLLGDSWFQLLMAGALGIVLTQYAFVTHEVAHRQVFASGRVNDRIGRLLANAVVGISYSWWMNKHNRHHANPNRLGKDPDIAPDTLVFVEDDARGAKGLKARFFKVQGYLFFPLLTLEGINLHVTSIRSVARTERGVKRVTELTTILVRLASYVGLVLWMFPVGLGFAFLGVQLAVFGVYMGASFAPNHKGMAIIPADVKLDFLSKQVLTSRNIRGGWFMNHLMGGLNYQIEHHLFPSMPRPHLARTRVIVKEHCRGLDMPYTETSLVESYRIVVRYLNRVGLGARDPFDCPAYHELRGV